MGHWLEHHRMGTTRTCSSCGDTFAETLDRCPMDGNALFSDEVMSRVGMLLKDHEIQSVIGEGGMGVVYRARHVVIEKPVAIKVLHDRFARQTEMVEQFIVEAKAASRIRHLNIIDVTDFGTTPEGLVFLVMEYLEGENLGDRLRRVGRVPAFDSINIIKQVANGLGAAHQLGVVHRDLKPANIFLCRREGRRRIVHRAGDADDPQFVVEPEETFDFVKLLDFGVAKLLDLGPSAATRAGMLCGSPHYLSPEQAQEKPATERSDIYALGATLYEMVTGTVPFDGQSMLEILNGHVVGVVVPPSQRAPAAGIDARLDAVILKCLEKDPERRFASTDEICDAIGECVTDRAFLRDAHRLPGIKESGFDLSQASAQARRNTPAARDPDKGFSEVEGEGERKGEVLADSGERGPRVGGTRFLGQTARIPRRRTGRNLSWMLMALLLVGGASAAIWALRSGDSPKVSAIAASSAPPLEIVPPVPPLPPAVPSPAVAPVAPVGLGSAPKTAITGAVPLPIAGLGKVPERAVDRPSVARPPLALGGARHSRLPAAPMPSEPMLAVAPAPKPPEPPPPAPPLPTVDVEALLREAQQAWTRQHYAVAIEKAREVLKTAPNRQAAHQIIAVCSCAVGAADDAREAASHLDEHKRDLVRTLCQRHGVTLE